MEGQWEHKNSFFFGGGVISVKNNFPALLMYTLEIITTFAKLDDVAKILT